MSSKSSLNTVGRVITAFAELRPYEAAWRELHANCTHPNAFTTWEWLWNWCKQFRTCGGSDTDAFRSPMLLLTVQDEFGCPVSMLPLYFSSRRSAGVTLTVLRMVGDMEEACDTPSEEPLVLLSQSRAQESIEAIQSYLRGPNHLANWDYVSLAMPYVAGMEETARKSQWSLARDGSVHKSEEFSLPADYETFRRSLHKSMRDNLSYYPRLLRRHGHSAKIRVAREPREMQAAIEILIDLHRRRAAGQRGPHHFDHLPSLPHQNFQRECLADLAANRLVSLYILDIDDEPAAVQCVLHGQDEVCFYYSGFDTAWYDYSPLTILSEQIFRDAIASGTRRVNLLENEHLWKTRWGAHSVIRYQRMVRPRLRPLSILRCATRAIQQRVIDHWSPIPQAVGG